MKLTLSGVMFCLAFAAVAHAQSPAFRADQFTDSIGINGSPLHQYVIPDGPYKGAGRTYAPEVFYDLGIRYYRTGLFNDLTLPDQPDQVKAAWETYGVRPMLLIDSNKTKTAPDILAKLAPYDPRSLAEIEGPNEVNNKFPPQNLNIKYGGRTDEAGGAAFMTDLYKALKANSAFKNVPVIAYTAIFTDYHLARPSAAFDFANMHSYQGSDVPSSSLLSNETRFNNILPPGTVIKPYVPTETGYNVEADKSNGTNNVGTLRAQALNIPMLLAEYFRHGIRRTYLFAIQNADGYGLLEDDLKTKRPSYFALKALMAQIKDSRWDLKTHRWVGGDFAPHALLYTLENAPPTVHTVTLQKRNGEYLLLIWNEVKNFDSNTHRDSINAPVPVNVRLQTPISGTATVLTQNAAGGYDTRAVMMKNGTLPLAVPSSVMLVRLKPALAELAPIPVAPPRSVSGTATENRVQLKWLPAGPQVAGYFVYRNGGFLAATRGLTFDDASPWIRPGLGYTYAVQSYAHTGAMSPRVSTVVQTPDRRPDLVCTDVVIPKVHAGEAVAFQATLENRGDGATPTDTAAGATFFVDGQYATYSTTGGKPFVPGESRVLTANGGGKEGRWTATAGAHVLRVQVDDVNRIPSERSKENNNTDRTFWVDVPASGLLFGAADPAPGQVDLTDEGTADWVHWGLGGKDGVTRKASGGHQLGDLQDVGSGYRDTTSGFGMSAKWSDGVPTAKMADTHASLWLNGVGHGYRFTAPADQRERVLRVYVGGIEGAACSLTAHLSDGSAPDYVSKTFDGNLAFDWAPVPGGFTGVYTIRYRAASAHQTLNITWKLDREPNQFLGQARLQSATLVVTGRR